MDTNLNIRTTVQTAPVTQLRTTVKQLRDEWNGMSADARKSPAGRELASQINELNNAIRTSNPNWSAMRAHVMAHRGEMRALTFVALELGHAFDGLSTSIVKLSGGTEKQAEGMKHVTSTFQEAVTAGLGVNFAMSTLGTTFAAWAGPVGIVAGIVVGLGAFVGKLDEVKQKAKEIMALSNKTSGEIWTQNLQGMTPPEVNKVLKMLQSQQEAAAIERAQTPSFITTASGLKVENPEIAAMNMKVQGYNPLIQATKEYAEKLELEARVRKIHAASIEDEIKSAKNYESLSDDAKAFINARFQKKMQLEQETSLHPNLGGQQTTIAGRQITRGEFESEESFMARQKTVLDVANSEAERMNKTTLEIVKSFDRVGTSIEQNIIGKLHFANNLAGQLAQELVLSAINLAGTLASGGSMPGIGGLFLGLVGAGKARSGITMSGGNTSGGLFG